MLKLSPIARIYNEFRLTLGNRMLFVMALMCFSAILETVGIVIFIPIIILSFGNMEAISQNEFIKGNLADDIIQGILDFLSLENNFQNIVSIIIIFFLSKSLLSFLSLTYASRLRSNLLYELKSQFYENITELDFQHFLKLDQGKSLSIAGDNINRSAQAFHNFMLFSTQSVNFLIFIIVAIYISPIASFGVFIIAISLYSFFRFLNKLSIRYSKDFVDENNQYISLMKIQLNNQKYFSAINMSNYLHPMLNTTVRNLRKIQYSVGLVKALISAIREPIALLVIILYILLNSSVFKLEGAQLLTALFLIYRAINTLVSMQATWSNTLEFSASFDAVSIELLRMRNSKSYRHSTTSISEQDNFLVNFENVNYKYNSPGSFRLSNINLNIKKNRIYGIVGKSGSGKTTLIDLILGLIAPLSGEITHSVDNSFSVHRIGYVPQTITLIPGTIRDNICLFETSADLIDQVWLEEVVRTSGLLEVIKSLPDGLETAVLDDGENFSGGQRQRIMIARELYRRTDLLVLDEPTSGLDASSEALITESLHELKKFTSVIIVSHEYDVIKKADEVMVIENGIICEVGRPEQLISKDGSKLSELFMSQTALRIEN